MANQNSEAFSRATEDYVELLFGDGHEALSHLPNALFCWSPQSLIATSHTFGGSWFGVNAKSRPMKHSLESGAEQVIASANSPEGLRRARFDKWASNEDQSWLKTGAALVCSEEFACVVPRSIEPSLVDRICDETEREDFGYYECMIKVGPWLSDGLPWILLALTDEMRCAAVFSRSSHIGSLVALRARLAGIGLQHTSVCNRGTNGGIVDYRVLLRRPFV